MEAAHSVARTDGGPLSGVGHAAVRWRSFLPALAARRPRNGWHSSWRRLHSAYQSTVLRVLYCTVYSIIILFTRTLWDCTNHCRSFAVPRVYEQRGRDERSDVQYVGGELEPRARSTFPSAGTRRHS